MEHELLVKRWKGFRLEANSVLFRQSSLEWRWIGPGTPIPWNATSITRTRESNYGTSIRRWSSEIGRLVKSREETIAGNSEGWRNVSKATKINELLTSSRLSVRKNSVSFWLRPQFSFETRRDLNTFFRHTFSSLETRSKAIYRFFANQVLFRVITLGVVNGSEKRAEFECEKRWLNREIQREYDCSESIGYFLKRRVYMGEVSSWNSNREISVREVGFLLRVKSFLRFPSSDNDLLNFLCIISWYSNLWN